MLEMHERHPQYNWKKNKGYGTLDHRKAMEQFGRCDLHRKCFMLKTMQMKLEV
jgi:ribonuclease HII